jgi:translation initiation factor 5B
VAWRDERKRELEAASRKEIAYPAKLLFLPDHVFRTSKPAIFGVRVLAGRIRSGEMLMRQDGRSLGRIKAIRSGEKSLDAASQGQEVAISVDGVTIGRQVQSSDILYVELPEADARALRDRQDLSVDERQALEELAAIKRKDDAFWGM